MWRVLCTEIPETVHFLFFASDSFTRARVFDAEARIQVAWVNMSLYLIEEYDKLHKSQGRVRKPKARVEVCILEEPSSGILRRIPGSTEVGTGWIAVVFVTASVKLARVLETSLVLPTFGLVFSLCLAVVVAQLLRPRLL